jgi:hypothetical protein
MKMTNERSWRGLLHRATHRIPAVPAHAELPAGHQGTTVHGRVRRPGRAGADHSPNHRLNHRSDRGLNHRLNRKLNHSPARPARFMPAWQRRIAALFGREW